MSYLLQSVREGEDELNSTQLNWPAPSLWFRVSRASLEGLRKKRRLLVVYGVSGSVK